MPIFAGFQKHPRWLGMGFLPSTVVQWYTYWWDHGATHWNAPTIGDSRSLGVSTTWRRQNKMLKRLAEKRSGGVGNWSNRNDTKQGDVGWTCFLIPIFLGDLWFVQIWFFVLCSKFGAMQYFCFVFSVVILYLTWLIQDRGSLGSSWNTPWNVI